MVNKFIYQQLSQHKTSNIYILAICILAICILAISSSSYILEVVALRAALLLKALFGGRSLGSRCC